MRRLGLARRRKDREGARRAGVSGALGQGVGGISGCQCIAHYSCRVGTREHRRRVVAGGVAVLEGGVEVGEAHARDVGVGRLWLCLPLSLLRQVRIVRGQILRRVDAPDGHGHASFVIQFRTSVSRMMAMM